MEFAFNIRRLLNRGQLRQFDSLPFIQISGRHVAALIVSNVLDKPIARRATRRDLLLGSGNDIRVQADAYRRRTADMNKLTTRFC